MRHIIDLNESSDRDPGSYSRVTHVRVWDDAAEHVHQTCEFMDAYQARHGLPPQLAWGGPGDAQWLGRTDLVAGDWKALRRRALEPWEEGMKLHERILEQIRVERLVTPRSARRRAVWREDDGEFDYDRYAIGEPCYRGCEKRTTFGRQFVTLLAQVGAHCETSAESLAVRGATVAALTDILEREGYAVEILAYAQTYQAFCASPKRRGEVADFLNVVRVKAPEDLLDPVALVNATSPWAFRLFYFANFFQIKGESPDPVLGYPRPLPDRLREEYLTTDPDRWHVENVWDVPAAVALAKTLLARLAEETEEAVR